jgi:ketol-acid reductoisomerase
LADIQNGAFAEEWIEENQNGLPRFFSTRRAMQQQTIEEVGKGLRAMMPWLKPVAVETEEPVG